MIDSFILLFEFRSGRINSNHFSEISKNLFYLMLLLLAIIFFYFSISGNLFVWIYPDEETASKVYGIALANAHRHAPSLVRCAAEYYFTTTINRPSADLSLCILAKTASYFATPYLGWIFSRLIYFIMIPISIGISIKCLCQIPYKWSLIIALTVFSVVFFTISDYAYVYGAGLSIYGTALISFLLLISVFERSLKGRKWFLFFSLLFIINLTSHEVFLVISSLFIPLYAWFYHKETHYCVRTQSIIHKFFSALWQKRVLLLICIYLVCALLQIFAPGVGMRQKVWPTTGSFFDGLVYMIQTFEEVLFFLYRSKALVFFVFFLGVCTGLYFKYQKTFLGKYMGAMLLLSPLVYLAVAGFLFGITPSLWGHSIRPSFFQYSPEFLTRLVSNRHILNHSEFNLISRNLVPFTLIFMDVFLLGFFSMVYIQKKYAPKVKKIKLYAQFPVIGILVICILLHPDGMGSLRILPIFFKNDVGNALLVHVTQQSQDDIEGNIFSYLYPGGMTISDLTKLFFPRRKGINHKADQIYLLLNHLLHQRKNKTVAQSDIDLLYSFAPMVRYPEPMGSELMAMYNVRVHQKCYFPFSSKLKPICYNGAGNSVKVGEILQKAKLLSERIRFAPNTTDGIIAKKINGCLLLEDKPGAVRFHKIVSQAIHLDKGYYYFALRGDELSTDLYLYFLNATSQLYVTWFGTWGPSQGGTIQPIASQIEEDVSGKTMNILVYSNKPQSIKLVWQHGYALYPIYYHRSGLGKSLFCGASFVKL